MFFYEIALNFFPSYSYFTFCKIVLLQWHKTLLEKSVSLGQNCFMNFLHQVFSNSRKRTLLPYSFLGWNPVFNKLTLKKSHSRQKLGFWIRHVFKFGYYVAGLRNFCSGLRGSFKVWDLSFQKKRGRTTPLFSNTAQPRPQPISIAPIHSIIVPTLW